MSTGETHNSILMDIRKIMRAINLESKRIQKEFGVSTPQMLCLNYLRSCNDFQGTHKELVKFLNLNSSTVTGIVNRLEAKGLIARLPKKEDKRVTYICLTSKGNKLLDSAPDLMHDLLTKKLASIPKQEISDIRIALHKLITALDIEDIDASPLLVMDDPINPG